MPLYEYECQDCGYVTEVFRSVPERNNPADCNICGAKILTRLPARLQRIMAERPYYHHGLGCMVNSKEHYQKVCRETNTGEPVNKERDNGGYRYTTEAKNW